tara:strand:- start:5133 stop:5405 length:273 start_codon:yes stop_codon:yes gene_type:complete
MNSKCGDNKSVIDILKITNAILLPTNIVAIKLDSSFEKIDKILETKDPDVLSNSSLSLFEETKAISIPEKKAERNKVIITIVRDIFIYLY